MGCKWHFKFQNQTVHWCQVLHYTIEILQKILKLGIKFSEIFEKVVEMVPKFWGIIRGETSAQILRDN